MLFNIQNADKIALRTSSDIYRLMRVILDEEQRIDTSTKEHFWVISMNQHAKILSIELVSMGGFSSTILKPADVFSLPLHKKASYIVLVHPHPSDYLGASKSDLDMTNRLIHVGKLLSINVFDHLIMGHSSFYSLRDNGVVSELSMDTKYTLSFQERKALEEELADRAHEIRLAGEEAGREEVLTSLDALLQKEGIDKVLLDKLKKTLNNESPEKAAGKEEK